MWQPMHRTVHRWIFYVRKLIFWQASSKITWWTLLSFLVEYNIVDNIQNGNVLIFFFASSTVKCKYMFIICWLNKWYFCEWQVCFFQKSFHQNLCFVEWLCFTVKRALIGHVKATQTMNYNLFICRDIKTKLNNQISSINKLKWTTSVLSFRFN